jgi:GR25 family glycosyltransferase involved in LPS biosynthesis
MIDFFDGIFCINLKHRMDRWEKFISGFAAYYGIEKHVERIDGVIEECPKSGCFQAHFNAIKKALDEDLENVLILEDDAVPVKDETYSNIENLKMSMESLQCNEWDILILGHNQLKGRKQERTTIYNVVDENLLEINKSFGCHSYVLNRKGIRKMYNYMTLILKGSERRRAIDKIVNFNRKRKEKTICLCPRNFFITQDSFGGSDISEGNDALQHEDSLFRKFIKVTSQLT